MHGSFEGMGEQKGLLIDCFALMSCRKGVCFSVQTYNMYILDLLIMMSFQGYKSRHRKIGKDIS